MTFLLLGAFDAVGVIAGIVFEIRDTLRLPVARLRPDRGRSTGLHVHSYFHQPKHAR